MRFSSIILGSRLTWRNKRRVIIATAGLIIATAVLSSLFLVASFQFRVTILDQLNANDYHVIFDASGDYPRTCNVTDLKTIEELADEIAPRYGISGYSLNIKVDMPATRYSHYSNGSINYTENFFITTNSSVDWNNLSIPWKIAEIQFRGRNQITRYFATSVLSGSLPAELGELAVSEAVAREQNLTVGGTLYVGNNLTRHISGPLTISGIIDNPSFFERIILSSYDTMSTMALQLTTSGNIRVDQASITITFNTDTVNLYSINTFLDTISNFALDLQNAVSLNHLNYDVYNYINTISPVLFIPILATVIQYVPFMLPLIVLALFVSKFINTELLKAREREFVLLKSRGYTGKVVESRG